MNIKYISLFLAAFLASTQAQAQYFFDSQIISGSDVSLNTASFSLRGPVKSVHRQDIVYPEHCAMANPYIVFNAEGPQMQYRDIKFNINCISNRGLNSYVC